MKRYKSELDKSQQKKRELDESLDYIKQIERAPNSEAERKIVVDNLKEEEKVEQQVKDATADILQGKHQVTYHSRLADYGQTGLNELDWPPGWEYYCLATFGRDITIYGKSFATRVGILFIVKDTKANVYTRGVLTTMDPVVDMKNVDTLVVQAENTIDSAKGILLSDRETVNPLRKTEGGIYLPN